MLCFWGRNRGARNWSSEEDERRAAQLGELGGGMELHEGLFIGAERRWRQGCGGNGVGAAKFCAGVNGGLRQDACW